MSLLVIGFSAPVDSQLPDVGKSYHRVGCPSRDRQQMAVQFRRAPPENQQKNGFLPRIRSKQQSRKALAGMPFKGFWPADTWEL